jgi:multidrug efflux pump subunit AcrA (membrane-fusion protein)
MLLKLVPGGSVPGRYDHDVGQIERARILKWYKQEGDWVEYGDDLLEVDVEVVQAPANKIELKHRLEWLNAAPSQIAELAIQQLAGEAARLCGIEPGVLHREHVLRAAASFRIVANDVASAWDPES